MKKLPALLLLFGIISCETPTTLGVNGEKISINTVEYSSQYKGRVPDEKIVQKYEDLKSYYRAEIFDKDGNVYHLGQATQSGGWYGKNLKRDIQAMCYTDGEYISFINRELLERLIREKYPEPDLCIISKYMDTVYYEDFNDYKNKLAQQKQREANEEERQKQLILTALVDRCTNFGWKTEDNIASCVKQEAYRDLQIQEQEYKMKLLEQRLIASNTVEEKPFFLEVLNFYVEEAERQENAQLRRDIMMLQADTRSLKSKQNTQAALNALYRDN